MDMMVVVGAVCKCTCVFDKLDFVFFGTPFSTFIRADVFSVGLLVVGEEATSAVAPTWSTGEEQEEPETLHCVLLVLEASWPPPQLLTLRS